VAVIVTQVVCIFYLRADAIVAPCLGQLGSFVPPGQANTCARLKEFKQTSDVGVTFLLCFISFGAIVVLVAFIAYLRVREAALADPNSRAAKWMRTTCGRRLARYASKLEAASKEESEVVARVEARRASKAAAKAGGDSAGIDGLVYGGNAGVGGASSAGSSRSRAPRAAFDPTRADGNAATLGFTKGASKDLLATTVNPMRAVATRAQKSGKAGRAAAAEAAAAPAEEAGKPKASTTGRSEVSPLVVEAAAPANTKGAAPVAAAPVVAAEVPAAAQADAPAAAPSAEPADIPEPVAVAEAAAALEPAPAAVPAAAPSAAPASVPVAAPSVTPAGAPAAAPADLAIAAPTASQVCLLPAALPAAAVAKDPAKLAGTPVGAPSALVPGAAVPGRQSVVASFRDRIEAMTPSATTQKPPALGAVAVAVAKSGAPAAAVPPTRRK
jgi:hypothetical protein